jgi:lipopolysaccharide export system protein LptA
MSLKADRVVITEDQYGFQKGTAFGGKNGLAHFRQKREGKEEYIEGEGERIEYNTNSEILELFHRAWVKNGEDLVRGDYIWYDAISEKYLVTAGDSRDPKAPPARVRAVIQPKNKDSEAKPAPRGGALELKGTANLGSPNAQ